MSVTGANVRGAWRAIFTAVLAFPDAAVAMLWWPITASPEGTTAFSAPDSTRAGGDDASVRPVEDETAEMRRWVASALDPSGSGLPFSFTYDGQSSRDLLPAWSADSATLRLGRAARATRSRGTIQRPV